MIALFPRHFVVTVSAVALIALGDAGVARAATVTRAIPHVAPARPVPAGVRTLRRAAVPRALTNISGCTTVTVSSAVQSDLELPTTSATAALVIAGTGQQYPGYNVDGTGCDIAVYIAPTATRASVSDSVVHDGTRAGIVVDSATKTILAGDAVYNIGEHPGGVYTPDGVQYGFAVLVESAINPTVVSVDASLYQKEGFPVINSTGSLTYNTATGAGFLNYIASNGFEIDGSNLSALSENRTQLNQYTVGDYGAAGYIVCGTSVKNQLVTSLWKFAKQWQNLELFDDIPYYFSKHADCS